MYAEIADRVERRLAPATAAAAATGRRDQTATTDAAERAGAPAAGTRARADEAAVASAPAATAEGRARAAGEHAEPGCGRRFKGDERKGTSKRKLGLLSCMLVTDVHLGLFFFSRYVSVLCL